VDCPSIKNFILEDKPNDKDLVIFGKITENRFNMDVSYPISPYIAFTIALTSFDSRIMME
jgi:Tub family